MNWLEVIIAGVAGGVAGLLGAGLAQLLQLSDSARKTLSAVSIVVALGVVHGFRPQIDDLKTRMKIRSDIKRSLASAKASDRAIGYIMVNVENDPQLSTWFHAWLKHPIGPDTTKLSAQGVPTLPDDKLLVRAMLMSKMLAGLSVSECARIARGGVNKDAVFASLDGLSEAELRLWADMSAASMKNALLHAPVRHADEDLLAKAVMDAFVGFPSDRQLVAAKTAQDPKNASDKDACWLIRTLYDQVSDLPGDESAALALQLGTP